MMKKIVVTSNCQTGGLASSLKVIFPEYGIETFPTPRLSAENGIESLKDLLNPQDIWVTIQPKPLNDLSIQVIKIPKIIFRAFHPDLTYAHIGGTTEVTRIHYNSFIGAWAYNNKIDPEDAVKLYNHSIYEQLGYYDFWNKSVNELRKEFVNSDLTIKEFEKYILEVKRRGLFMHSINHPHIGTIVELGKIIASRIEPNQAQINRDIIIQDGLAASAVWPLYTEIGQELGLNGNYCWRIKGKEICGIKSYLEFIYQDYHAQGIEPGDLKCHNIIPNAEEILRSYK